MKTSKHNSLLTAQSNDKTNQYGNNALIEPGDSKANAIISANIISSMYKGDSPHALVVYLYSFIYF